ncbi:MAG: GNAT family N-acetyltransferase [Pseudomonadota bacterium]
MDLHPETDLKPAYLTTARLRLVPVTDVDPADVVAGIGNYDVARWLGRVPYPYRLEDAQAFVTANRAQAGRFWFILDPEGLVGGISIDRELGYWLARDAWGKGYATEAAEAVVDVHFADPAAGDLESNYFPGNDRSGAVLRKLGFARAGTRPVKSLSLSQTVESNAVVLTRAAWEASRRLEITTDRLILRGLRDSDWRRLQQIGGAPEVARMMLSMTAPWPEEDVRRWIAASQFRGRLGYRLGITLPGDALIGMVGIGPDRSAHYMLDRRHWGRGLMTEAMHAFLADIFARFPEVDRIEADHFTDNPGSGVVLRKLGFEQTGTGLGVSRARVERAPNVLYRLHRDAFGQLP